MIFGRWWVFYHRKKSTQVRTSINVYEHTQYDHPDIHAIFERQAAEFQLSSVVVKVHLVIRLNSHFLQPIWSGMYYQNKITGPGAPTTAQWWCIRSEAVKLRFWAVTFISHCSNAKAAFFPALTAVRIGNLNPESLYISLETFYDQMGIWLIICLIRVCNQICSLRLAFDFPGNSSVSN